MNRDEALLSSLLNTVERFYRDVRWFRLHEWTLQILQLIMARHLLTEAAA